MEKTIRQQAREKATVAIYQRLLVGATRHDMDAYIRMDGILEDGRSAKEYTHWLVDTVIKNKKNYISLIGKNLKQGWKFERLAMMEQAILLVGTAELLETDLDKSIVINEAVLSAKEFCDDDSYKFINGVLMGIAGHE